MSRRVSWWRRLVQWFSPFDLTMWAYEKWFLGHSFLGYILVCVVPGVVVSLMMLVFYTYVKDSYNARHPQIAPAPISDLQEATNSSPPPAVQSGLKAEMEYPFVTKDVKSENGDYPFEVILTIPALGVYSSDRLTVECDKKIEYISIPTKFKMLPFPPIVSDVYGYSINGNVLQIYFPALKTSGISTDIRARLFSLSRLKVLRVYYLLG